MRHRMSARLPLPTRFFLGPLSARAFLPSWPPSHRHSLTLRYLGLDRHRRRRRPSSASVSLRIFFFSVTMDEGEAPAPRIKGTAFVAGSLTDFRVLAESLPNKPRQQDAPAMPCEKGQVLRRAALREMPSVGRRVRVSRPTTASQGQREVPVSFSFPSSAGIVHKLTTPR